MSTPTVAPQLLVFMLPDLGEGLTEAELVSWLVSEGDTVAVDQPVAEVETAKSVVEVPSPFAGTVAVLHGRAGEVLDVGAPFLSVRPEGMDEPAEAPSVVLPDVVAGAAVDDAAALLRDDTGVPTPATQPDDRPSVENEGSGNVLIGYGTPGGLTGGRTRPRKGAAPSARRQEAAPTDPPVPADDGPGAPTAASQGQAPLCVSPLVRRLARDHGIQLHDVRGSGGKGLIQRRDVDAVIASRTGMRGLDDASGAPAGVDSTDSARAATAVTDGPAGSPGGCP